MAANSATAKDPLTWSDSAPDASISHIDALAYWRSAPATVDGMLGGFQNVSRIDLQGSKNFFTKLRRTSVRHHPGLQVSAKAREKQLLGCAVDCGAGIGRITAGLLSSIASTVDIVEPVLKFTEEITGGRGFAALREEGKIGNVYNVALQDWCPAASFYDLIWNQWCLGQLTDAQLVEYLTRCGQGVTSIGWIIVKENISTHPQGEDLFDETDSSVTRSKAKLKRIFDDAGLKVVAEEVQRGLPEALYPVLTFALRPETSSEIVE